MCAWTNLSSSFFTFLLLLSSVCLLFHPSKRVISKQIRMIMDGIPNVIRLYGMTKIVTIVYSNMFSEIAANITAMLMMKFRHFSL